MDTLGKKSGKSVASRGDARVARTRGKVLDAFRDLLLTQPLEDVTVNKVAKRARVGRSTLYEHFPGKPALLASSIAGPFNQLASALDAHPPREALERVLQHFWENRTLARSVFLGAPRRRVESVLVRLITEKLKARGLGRPGALLMPLPLSAAALAQLLLAPLLVWLSGEGGLTPGAFAPALIQTAQGALQALQARLL